MFNNNHGVFALCWRGQRLSHPNLARPAEHPSPPQVKRDHQADSDGEVGSVDHAVAALMQLADPEPEPLRAALEAILAEFCDDGSVRRIPGIA